MAHIQALPDELLLKIWGYNISRSFPTLQCEPSWPRTKCSCDIEAPIIPFAFTASWVTHRWRDIAVNTSALWCDVDILRSRSVELLDIQLQRSKDRSIALTACVCSHATSVRDGRTMTMGELLSSISVHLCRCYLLELGVWAHHIGHGESVLWYLHGSHFPRLKYLYVCSHQRSNFLTRPIIAHAPVLTHVDFCGVDIKPDLEFFTGLICLRLRRCDSSLTQQQFHDLIGASPSMIELSLDLCRLDYDSTPTLTPFYPTIHAPSLRSFTICVSVSTISTFRFCRFLGSLSAPSLHSLKITEIRPWEPHIAVKMVMVPFLELDDGRLNLRRCFPSMDYLELNNTGSPTFLRLQYEDVCGSSGEILWPNLRTLCCPNYPASSHALLQGFISQRMGMGVPITKLRTTHGTFASFDTEDKQWYRDHLDVVLYDETMVE